MSKIISIKLTKASINIGPFDVYDQTGSIIATGVSREELITGKSFIVEDSVAQLSLKSTGKCKSSVTKNLTPLSKQEYNSITVSTDSKACLWTHLIDHTLYNSYYGNKEPYVIEYPFAYTYNDQILQEVNEYSKVYKHLKNTLGISSKNDRIAVDDAWFNKSIIYNDQQSSGVLELVAKPLNNMKEYLTYPKYNDDSKSILWTKVDNVYNYNTFWSMVKNKAVPLFKSSCETLSIDKVINQDNMDYSVRAYKKETIRAKDLKVRHTLDNRDDIVIVTQFILTPAMQSYL
jgi:hypothetical protein